MGSVASLNMGAHNDGPSLTPQVTHFETISSMEYLTIVNGMIMSAIRAQKPDILSE